MSNEVTATTVNARCARTKGKCGNWCTDREILQEAAELLVEVGDIVYGSVVVDIDRRQISAKLQDGRSLRMTMVIA
jgi:hypothetical protein